MNRRTFIHSALTSSAAAAAAALGATGEADPMPKPDAARPVPPFELDEVTIDQLQRDMQTGARTARSIVEAYLARIDAIDKHGPGINSVIELNPDALEIADRKDRERGEHGPRGHLGPLHGVPVLIKDNIDTADRMMTTAGSLALVGPPAPRDSGVAQRLREAGAIILGKTNLSEWANIRSSHSVSGWSGRGGLTRNPYALDRNCSGSSSGSGAAASANLCAVAVGTETDGSITSPSNTCGLVGIKPTLGLVSRAGVVPISHSQDTAGPMARTVRDAAILLGALRIAAEDPRDPATADAAMHARDHGDYTRYLDPNGLRGARLGVARKFFGFHEKVDSLMGEALATLKRCGAELVDPADIPTSGKFDDSEFEVLLYELKADMAGYLATRGPDVPVKSLAEIIAFNAKHADREMPYFGQDTLIKAQSKGPLTTKRYLDALEKNHRLARTEGIDAVLRQHRLDALVAPTGGPAWTIDLVDGDHGVGGGTTSPPAVAGYPHITVPAGYVFGLPVGLSFFGAAWTEPTLVRLAYAFEQATHARRAPRFLPAADLAAPQHARRGSAG